MLIAGTLNDSVFAWSADNGNLLWSRQGDGSSGNPIAGGGSGGAALWFDDCTHNGGPVPVAAGDLPFAGVISTPVVDTAASPDPVMFITGACVRSNGDNTVTHREWWLHEIDLTTGCDVGGAYNSSHQCTYGSSEQHMHVGSDFHSDGITEGWQKQRSALLEIRNAGASTDHMVYVAFGTWVPENDSKHPYNGWLLGYTTNSSNVLSATTLAFSTAPVPSGQSTPCGGGGGSVNNGGTWTAQCPGYGVGEFPPSDCYCTNPSNCPGAPNWGAHGGGIWMSSRGAAASCPYTSGTGSCPISTNDGNVHVLFGSGNGGFQITNVSPNSYGESLIDLRLTQTGFDTSPHAYFTPGSPASYVGPPSPGNVCGCDSSGNNCGACTFTFQTMNVNDQDMAVSGVLLFVDLGGNVRMVSIDKSGYGYFVTSPFSMSGFAGWDSHHNPLPDSGVWTFGAPYSLNHDDRVTSMAFYSESSTGPAWLYFWPNEEKLTAFQLSDNSSQTSTGTLSTTGSSAPYTHVTIGGTGSANQVVVGDQITNISGQATQTVTTVNDDSSSITVMPGFTSAQSSVTGWKYNGYFINPVRDSAPPGSGVGYPGGALGITANGTATAVVWGLIGSNVSTSGTNPGPGTIYAYPAVTTTYQLQKSWNSTDNFCAANNGTPTISNGKIYVPTYSINPSGDTTTDCPPTTDPSGSYYSGIKVYY